MTAIPLPSIAPYWEHPGDRPRKLSTWKHQIDSLIDLTNSQLDTARHLGDPAKNRLLFAYLGTEALRRFEHNPVVARISTMSYKDFYEAIAATFDTPTLPALAFFRFRTCRQEANESATEFVNRLRTLQADCDYREFNADTYLAYVLTQNCHSVDVQKRLFNTQPVNLDKYVAMLQAEESAAMSAAAIRTDAAKIGSAMVNKSNNRPNNARSEARRQTDNRQQHRKSSSAPANKKQDACAGCGSPKHKYKASDCPALNCQCPFCDNVGHYERCCIKKKKSQSAANPINQPSKANNMARCHRVTAAVIETASPPAKQQFRCSVEISAAGRTTMIDACIDSGSDISTITHAQWSEHFSPLPLKPVTIDIFNFDGSQIINAHGWFDARVSYNKRTVPLRLYVFPDNFPALLGLDAIAGLGLQLDGTSYSVRNVTSSAMPLLLSAHPELLRKEIGRYPDFEHRIVLSDDARPTARSLRPVPIARRAAVDEEIDLMVRAGIWERIDKPSAWAHHLVTVPKTDGGVRITTDLSPLNKYVIPERFPLPKIRDLYLQLQGAKLFSKLDLYKGYYQVVLHPESRPLTATITPKGIFQYTRMPMGLTDGASVFQRLVSQTLADCPGCVAYLDDILVFGSSGTEHDRNLAAVLQRLSNKQFRLNPAKCIFSVPEVSFLGHVISASGIKPNPILVDAIRNFPQPCNKKQVQSFLGMINFYRDYLPNLASFAEPLQQLTRTTEKPQFDWSERCSHSFTELKDMVSADLKVHIFDPNCPTIVTTDASDIGLGAVLSQIQSGREVPIAFASHTLQPTERAYAANEREALACIWACEHWSDFLIGRHFTLVTDHAALTTSLSQSGTGRKAHKFDRWRARLEQFDYTVHHRPGQDNVFADALSRFAQRTTTFAVPTLSDRHAVRTITTNGFSIARFAQGTAADLQLSQVIEFVQSQWPDSRRIAQDLRPFHALRDQLFVQDGCLFRTNGALVVPNQLRRPLLTAAHVGHPGIVRAKTKMRESYWWPGMSSAIEDFVRHCHGCQESSKSAPNGETPSDPLPAPTAPWQRVAIDVTGPFHTAPYGHRFIVALIDHYSGFPEILLTGAHDTTTIINWLTELFARYGNPNIILSDNGPEFVSKEFEDFLAQRDIIHHRTPVYHPRTNGRIEVFNRSLKFHAQTMAASNYPFAQGMMEFIARYRAEPTAHSASPAELFLQRRTRLPYEFNSERLQADAGQNATRPASQAPQPARPLHTGYFHMGDCVRVHRPAAMVRKGQSPYSPVLTVTEVLGTYTYRLSDGQVWNARRMRRYSQPPFSAVAIDVSEQSVSAPATRTTTPPSSLSPASRASPPPRRSTRPTRGKPSKRYSPPGHTTQKGE